MFIREAQSRGIKGFFSCDCVCHGHALIIKQIQRIVKFLSAAKGRNRFLPKKT